MKTFAIFLFMANLLVLLSISRSHESDALSVTEAAPALQYIQFDGELALLDRRVAAPAEAEGAQPASLNLGADVVATAPNTSGQDASPRAAWCGASADLTNEAIAAQFEIAAAAAGAQVTIQRMEIAPSFTWWVHTVRYESESAARVDLRSMQAKSIDSFYMRSGELEGRISLGVFSREESARKVQSEIAKQGYSVEISKVEKIPKDLQIEVKLDDREQLKSSEWLSVLNKNTDVTLLEIECK